MRMQPESKMTERAMMAAWIAATLLCTVAAIKPANAAPSRGDVQAAISAAHMAQYSCKAWPRRIHTRTEYIKELMAVGVDGATLKREIAKAKRYIDDAMEQARIDCKNAEYTTRKANELINEYNRAQ